MAATLLGKLNSGSAGSNELVVEYIVGISAESDWNSALTATGLPAFGEVHPGRAGYYAIDINARPANEQNHYRAIVTVRYQPAQVSLKPTAPWNDPATYVVNDRPQAWYDGKYYDTTAAAWKLNTNSAGDIYDPTQPREIYMLEIAVTACKQASVWTPSSFDAARGKVNSDQITICGRTCAQYYIKLVAMPYSKKYWLNPATTLLEAYYEVTFVLLYHPQGWKMEQLDAGFREKDSTTNKLKMIQETDPADTSKKRIVQRMAKLNGSGASMSETDQADPTKFTYLPGRLFCETYAFSGLGLPTGE